MTSEFQYTVSEAIVVKGRRVPIQGFVASGFEPVLDAFKRNFQDHQEIGAACSAYVSGECVVDLWGGFRSLKLDDHWRSDTMVILMSTTKGLAALAAAVAHSRGLLDFAKPVAHYWPEFGQYEKSAITVRQLLAHQAGLCAFDTLITVQLLADHDGLAALLARQRPAWLPGTRHGYHAMTLGLYLSELLRRVDPKHRTLGTYFWEEVAEPLGGEMYIGLPDSVPDERIAEIKAVPDFAAWFKMPFATTVSMFNPKSLTFRTTKNPRLKRPEELSSRAYLRVELPSANGVATPRAIARAYGDFASGGKRLGVRSETLTLLESPAIAPELGQADAVFGVDFSYSLGFCKPFPRFSFSVSSRAYGTAGVGGSQGFADPDTSLGFAYAPNRLIIGDVDDARARALRNAVYSCLRG
jgi:CubicO group peptidase (beta-lactamase class C family)